MSLGASSRTASAASDLAARIRIIRCAYPRARARSCMLLQRPRVCDRCHPDQLLEVSGEVALIDEPLVDSHVRRGQTGKKGALGAANPHPELVGVGRQTVFLLEDAQHLK